MSTEIIPVKEVSENRSQVLAVQKQANDFAIKTQADVETGEEMLRAIRDVENGMDARKSEITRPLMKSLASIRDLFKPLELGLADAKKTVKSKILAHQIESEEKARIAAEKIAARVEKGTMRADTAAGKIEAIQSSKGGSKNTRTLRKLLISDETALPREFLVPDREAITKALFSGVVVPGASLIEEKILVTK